MVTIKTHMTASVAEEMNSSEEFSQFVLASLCRHLSGDWGDVSEADKETNAAGPMYALSTYTYGDVKIWIKQDGTILTVLFPDES